MLGVLLEKLLRDLLEKILGLLLERLIETIFEFDWNASRQLGKLFIRIDGGLLGKLF